jgi:hypothetical protein
VDKPDLTQSFFSLGHTGIRRSDPDRDAVIVMNYVLGGGGFSSRLMKIIRSDKGKTYGIKSRFEEAEVDGAFVVQSFTRNKELLNMIRLVQRELERVRQVPPSADEILAAKGHIAGGFAIRMQTAAQILSRLMHAQIWGFPATFVSEFPLRVDRLSPEEISRAARSRIRPDRLVAAVVGRAAEVAPLLRSAGIPFEQVSYLDPISARERMRKTAAESVTISPAEEKRARAVLQRVLLAAGGKQHLAAVRSLRLTGRAKVENMEGSYSAILLLPDHLRQAFDTQPVPIVQILAGDRGFIQAGPAKRALPLEVARRMRGLIWRDPVLLPLHAMAAGVRCRFSPDPSLSKDRRRIALELFPEGLPPATVIVDARSARLLQIRYADRSGQVRVSDLADHRMVPPGILVPHRVTEVIGKRTQSMAISRVEINPKIGSREILEGVP